MVLDNPLIAWNELGNPIRSIKTNQGSVTPHHGLPAVDRRDVVDGGHGQGSKWIGLFQAYAAWGIRRSGSGSNPWPPEGS